MLRKIIPLLLLATLVLAGCNEAANNNEAAQSPVALDNDYKKLSYGLGLNIGGGIAQQNVPELDVDALIAGIREAIEGKEARVTQEELSEVVSRIQAEEAEKMEKLAQENLREGEAFLSENSQREGVTTTESGLQYEVLERGEGESPQAEDIVSTHYHGTLIDGTVFDSSVERGEPVQFAVNQVIPGWTEALQLMKPGAKWRLYVPANLAYGEYSPGPEIPPQSTLIFEVELLDVESPAEAEAAEDADSTEN